MRVEAQYFFDAKRHLVSAKLVLQARFLSQERIGAIGGNHDGSIEVAIFAATAHANDLFVFVKQIIDNGRGNEEGSCFFRFASQPAIKPGA